MRKIGTIPATVGGLTPPRYSPRRKERARATAFLK
jgi:hypothetical protein